MQGALAPAPGGIVLYYGMLFITPLVLAASMWLGGSWAWLPPAALFGAVPLLDLALPLRVLNRAGPEGWREGAYRALPGAWVILQLGLTAGALWLAARGAGSGWERAGLVAGAGVAGGMMIGVAHELMHRDTWVERRLADLAMISVGYPHFCVEHVYGHHRNVGTREDPATARLGESLYAFLPRTLHGSLVSAWGIEARRLARAGRSAWGPGNRVLAGWAAWAAVAVGIGLWLGPWGAAAFVAQGVIAVLLLETVNYVEHYGLEREIGPDGRPVRVAPRHSWNSSHMVANALILNLARHSDHHAHPGRRYPDLRHFDDVPQLPASYPAMMILATLPPLWSWVMDRRVADWREGWRGGAGSDSSAPSGIGQPA